MADRPLRLGVLGAARNVPFSLMKPVRSNPDLAAKIEVVSVASLELPEAEALAKEWNIPKAYFFDDMLKDPSVDAVYNVLPASLRCQFTVKALLAGKHVFSETPFCCNAREALVLQRAAEDSGRVLLEGSHPLCHPLTLRLREMIVTGTIGNVERVDMNLPLDHSIQGKAMCTKTGALMGTGVHAIAILRKIVNDEPAVTHASAEHSKDQPTVDSTMKIDMSFASGATAHISCSVAPNDKKRPTTITVYGSLGNIFVKEWFTNGHEVREIVSEVYDDSSHKINESVGGDNEAQDVFYHSLMSFADEVRDQEHRGSVGMPWDYTNGLGPADGLRVMSAIDSAYRAAGMSPKPSENPPPEPYNRIGLSKL